MKREDQFTPHLIVSDGLAALDFYKQFLVLRRDIA